MNTFVRFPEDLRPEGAPVYGFNECRTRASPEQLWAWLIRATRWPEWYPYAKRVVIETPSHGKLQQGTRFTWTTSGVRVVTTVEEFVPYERLSWRGRGVGALGYHGFVLLPDGSGTRIVTEEVQRGLLPWLGRALIRKGLLRYHQVWIEQLAKRAEHGSP